MHGPLFWLEQPPFSREFIGIHGHPSLFGKALKVRYIRCPKPKHHRHASPHIVGFNRLQLLFTAIVCDVQSGFAQYSLTVESSPASAVAGQTVYRFYVDMQAPEDALSAVYGDRASISFERSDGFFNSVFNASWVPLESIRLS